MSIAKLQTVALGLFSAVLFAGLFVSAAVPLAPIA